MTTTILIIVNVFSALAIIVLALMQQSKGDMGSAFGGGSSQSMFGARGSANFLSRTTAVMCVVFFASSLSLAYIYAQRAESSSVIGETSVLEQPSGEGDELPAIDGLDETSMNESGESNEQGLPAVPGDAAEPAEIEDGSEATDELPDLPEQN